MLSTTKDLKYDRKVNLKLIKRACNFRRSDDTVCRTWQEGTWQGNVCNLHVWNNTYLIARVRVNLICTKCIFFPSLLALHLCKISIDGFTDQRVTSCKMDIPGFYCLLGHFIQDLSHLQSADTWM